jgi:cobalt-zinc-cadmium efflux system membrane fusion protein
MTVADLGTVWVASDVPESSVRLIRVGDPVKIELLAYPGERLIGRVARIADTLDPQTRTVKVYVELPNAQGRLRPEMFGSVRHSGAVKMMPTVPAVAVLQEYWRSIVFLERAPGQYERRPVTLGPPSNDRLPVLAGLLAGDRVVVDGAMLLKDR